MALLLHKYWESALKKSSCLYWWCLVKKSPNLCPLIIVSQRCCHSMEEAEILSTSGRTWKKQGKEGLEGTYYFGFIAKWNFGWFGRLGLFFPPLGTLHSFWHLIYWKKNPADVTSEVKIIIVITAVAPNFSIEEVTWQKLSINTYIPPIWQERASQTYFTGESPRLIELRFGFVLKYIGLVNDSWQ